MCSFTVLVLRELLQLNTVFVEMGKIHFNLVSNITLNYMFSNSIPHFNIPVTILIRDYYI